MLEQSNTKTHVKRVIGVVGGKGDVASAIQKKASLCYFGNVNLIGTKEMKRIAGNLLKAKDLGT